MRWGLLLIPAVLVLAGCGGGSEDAVSEPTDDYLQITVGSSDSTDVETWTLVCGDGSDDDSHPDPAAACAHLEGLDDPFAALPADVVCTEQYGGPQTAHVIGRWNGDEVDLELARNDGCRIAQWDSLVPVVPAAG
jgi:Subtilisin inhibitor-like